MKISKKILIEIPDDPGIYKFIDNSKNIIYIGKAKSLKKRVSSYFVNKNLGPKTDLMVSKIYDIQFTKVFSEFEAILLEAEQIKKYKPFFNIQSKDDKSPLYIKISTDKIPLISTTRNGNAGSGTFAKGPFASSQTAKDVLKIARKIFPYCHHKNPKKPCLYTHLGLCPYPYASESAKKIYTINIQRIKKLLEGKSTLLIKELKKEMNRLSSNQKYEEALEVKKKIENLEFLSTTYHSPKEFLETPTLVDDLRLLRLQKLQKILDMAAIPKRIECYDISNIQGKHATGSMVVFENGKKEKSQYRRFRIRFLQKPNDYEMLKQVLSRRLKNNWPKPDLIIIDGGKGQLTSAKEAVLKAREKLNIISIAKRFEEIYTMKNNLPIVLPKENMARQLVEEIRNEAHRFAITYHRHLRSKDFLPKT